MPVRFSSVLSLFLLIHIVNCTLLSRFKYPNEYVAKEDEISLDELDEEIYQNLMDDLPQLKHLIKTGKHVYRRRENEVDVFGLDGEEYEDYITANDTEYDDSTIAVTQNITINVTTTRMPLSTYWPLNSNTSRRLIDLFLTPYIGKRVAVCYWCGNNVKGIPRSPLCHDMFDSQDGRARTLKRFHRAYCYNNKPRDPAHRKKVWWYGGYRYDWQKGLIDQYYGRFHGGCYKRFLDVGEVYTQRGCRYWWPMGAWHIVGYFKRGEGRSFAAHRFKVLEATLKREKDKCIMSPAASLTPFARTISLYVRYHVCVCSKRYCNRSTLVEVTNVLIGLIAILFITLSKLSARTIKIPAPVGTEPH